MSLAGTTGILDGIQAAAVPVRRRRLRLLPYALLAPSLLFLVLFTYLPVARVLVESFYDKPHGTGAATTFVGLGNYAKVLADPAFRQAALNNLVYAVGVLVPTLVLALAFALAVQRSTRFSAVLRTVFFFPSLVPLVAAASLFFFIFLPRVGLLDYYLAKIGLQGPNWLGDSDVALWSVIGLTVWKNAGYYMLFYIAGLQNVPRDTIEAAMIDGANAWQRLRFVILPALAPTTAFVVVIALIQLLTNVDHVIVLTRGGPSNATNLLLYYIFQSAHENFEYGKAAAATLMSVAVLLAISLGSLRIMERGARGMAKICRSAPLEWRVLEITQHERGGSRRLEKHLWPALAALLSAVAFLWASPFLWTLIASFRPESAGSAGMASLWPDFAPTLCELPQCPR